MRIELIIPKFWGIRDQQAPVTEIDLQALEGGQIDWSQFPSKAAPVLKPKKTLRAHQREVHTAVAKALALLSQILTEWTQETEVLLHCFAVCSPEDHEPRASGGHLSGHARDACGWLLTEGEHH